MGPKRCWKYSGLIGSQYLNTRRTVPLASFTFVAGFSAFTFAKLATAFLLVLLLGLNTGVDSQVLNLKKLLSPV